MPNTLRKSERLDKKKVIEKMFAGGSRSFSVFPLRVVYLAVLTEKKCRLAVAFIYLSDQLVDSSVIEDRMKTALARIAEKVAANAEAEQTPQVS